MPNYSFKCDNCGAKTELIISKHVPVGATVPEQCPKCKVPYITRIDNDRANVAYNGLTTPGAAYKG